MGVVESIFEEGMIMSNGKQEKTVLDLYIGCIYKFVMLGISGGFLCAVMFLSTLRLLGYYKEVSPAPLYFLIVMDIVCAIISIALVKNAYEDGIVKSNMLLLGKVYLTIIVCMQYILLLYVVPSREFWGFTFFFVFFISFFLDIRFTAINFMIMLLSYIIITIVKDGSNLPVKDLIFVPDLAFRIVAYTLTIIQHFAMITFIKKYLVNMKKDEITSNNALVSKVLINVSDITKQLAESSENILIASQNQNSATEELSSIASNLLDSNKSMLEKSDDSEVYLKGLIESSGEVDRKMREVDGYSRQLMQLSSTNGEALKNLVAISEKTKEDTIGTVEVMKNLLTRTKWLTPRLATYSLFITL